MTELVELVVCPSCRGSGRRLRRKFLCQLDLVGLFSRSEDELLDATKTSSDVARLERFRGFNHDHLLCECATRVNDSQQGAAV